MEPSLIRASKFLSLVLRHNPGKIGLVLDPHGWADVDDLLLKARRLGLEFDRSFLEKVVAENDKQRFAFSPDGLRIRASQGHSIQVDLQLEPQVPPDILYHGTAARFQASIIEQGLLHGRRQHVHLSMDLVTAITVGRRHGQPVVFQVDARAMHDAGLLFYLSANAVWLTAHVPAEYLRLLDVDQEICS